MGETNIFSRDERTLRAVPGMTTADRVLAWTENGIYVSSSGSAVPMTIDLLDPSTGGRHLWRTLAPSESSSVVTKMRAPTIVAHDVYGYTVVRMLSDLVVADDLR